MADDKDRDIKNETDSIASNLTINRQRKSNPFMGRIIKISLKNNKFYVYFNSIYFY